MTSFRTEIKIIPGNALIDLKTPVFTVGSCFAEAMGQKLQSSKISTMTNVFGAIYNPHSIHRALLYAIHDLPPAPNTFTSNQDVHLNFDFHSQFSSLDQLALQSNLKDVIARAHQFLQEARWIMITYGTSWLYRRNDTNDIVANCHKLPASNFKKELMHEKQVVESFQEFYKAIKGFNPGIKIILTVSPVRHIKDTLELNSVSKAVLRMACHTIVTAHQDVEYFPAYEIMMDDLRDYRFYKTDMLHPTAEAEEYIWNKFANRYFNEATKNFIQQWNSISSALKHRPFHAGSQAHQNFIKDTLKRLEELKSVVNVDEEIANLKKQLTIR